METKIKQDFENSEEDVVKSIKNNRNKIIIVAVSVFVLIIAGVAGLIYWNTISSRTYIDNCQVSAPVTNLIPTVGGQLQEVFVNVGDSVGANAFIARAGNELIKAPSKGQILSINTNIGATFGPNQPVATMIDPNDLRVVGQVQEDQGLKDIKIGQTAIFTVDAFGSKEYRGIVDGISPTGSGVFDVSGTRKENKFDVNVRFDVSQYPELKNGMSAKIWIYK